MTAVDAPARAPAAKLLDLGRLIEYVPGDDANRARYVDMFFDVSTRNLDEAAAACAAGQPAAAAAVGHRLKSSAKMLGAEMFVALCRRLEACDTDAVAALLIVNQLRAVLVEMAGALRPDE